VNWGRSAAVGLARSGVWDGWGRGVELPGTCARSASAATAAASYRVSCTLRTRALRVLRLFQSNPPLHLARRERKQSFTGESPLAQPACHSRSLQSAQGTYGGGGGGAAAGRSCPRDSSRVSGAAKRGPAGRRAQHPRRRLVVVVDVIGLARAGVPLLLPPGPPRASTVREASV